MRMSRSSRLKLLLVFQLPSLSRYERVALTL